MANRRLLISIALTVALPAVSLAAAAAEGGSRLVRLGERLHSVPHSAGTGYAARVEPAALERASIVEVELPRGELASARRSRVERRQGQDLLWTGRTALGEQLVLTVTAGRLAGTLFGRERTYQIYPDGDGSHAVLEVDSATLPGCGGAPLHGPTAEGRELRARVEADRESSAANRTPRIDLLVLYVRELTAAVRTRRNARAIVQHYVDLTNVALHNSEVEARVRLAHAAEVTLPDGVTGDSALDWLVSSRSVAELRDAHGADMVGLILDQNASFCGAAAMIYRPGGATLSRAFFVSRRVCGADTFAHEVGHILGADHNPEDASVAAGRYIYGRGHYYDGRYRTVMSYDTACEGRCPAQPFFSSPGVRYDRRTTGLRNERDNARIIDEFAAEVERFSPEIDDPACRLEPGDPDFCLECGPCVGGEGNCEADSECAPGLFCAPDSGEDFGLAAGVNVCRAAGGCDLDPGDPDYCRRCGPCGFGAGDCDIDRECQGGLICVDDVGATFGLPPATDVCAFRERGFCPLAPGDRDYCEACGPCEAGEGNCKSTGECDGFLNCFDDVGPELGFRAGTSVCLQAAPEDCPFQPGAQEYCALCGLCDVGEGDCDGDRQCRAGLSCVDGAGVDLGFGPEIDVCLESGGGVLAAPKRLKAKALSSTRVRLKWKDKSNNEEGFHVEMSTAGGPFERIGTTAAGKRKLFVDGLASGTTYTFRVQAFNAEGTSAYSNERRVTTP